MNFFFVLFLIYEIMCLMPGCYFYLFFHNMIFIDLIRCDGDRDCHINNRVFGCTLLSHIRNIRTLLYRDKLIEKRQYFEKNRQHSLH